MQPPTARIRRPHPDTGITPARSRPAGPAAPLGAAEAAWAVVAPPLTPIPDPSRTATVAAVRTPSNGPCNLQTASQHPRKRAEMTGGSLVRSVTVCGFR